ncbi:metallophosphoesterase [Bacillus sp. Marseille-P3661]|uniref:metallophosphoesterase n=1 Tax=Bacillus sp. Marseille-P3661 TaxID=1936234 RepID=UPI0021556848|nr:metallophosphoesterase [Bacillus sp. Marseille-P3661]
MLIANVILVISLVAIFSKFYFDTNYFKLNKVIFKSNKLPKGESFTILQLSDLHNKVFGLRNERLIHAVERAKADIIVLTGDLIDRRTKSFEEVFHLIEKLTMINKHVYFVSGNHEWGNARKEDFMTGLKKRNVTVLDNNNVQFNEKKVTVNLVGIANYSTQHHDLDKAMYGIVDKQYTVLLSHSPTIIETFKSISADLILSGHTHGGQVRFPFIGAIVVPDQGFFPKLAKGTYKLEGNKYLYIDSGLGTSNLPIRFLNQSQFSLITIKNDR